MAGVRRLQPDVVAFAVEALQGGVGSIDEGDDDVSVVRRLQLLDQDVVAVEMASSCMESPRTSSTNTSFERTKSASEMVSIALHGFDGLAGGDAPQQRQHQAGVHAHGLLEASLGRQQVDGSAAVVVAGEQSFFLEVGDVLVHRGQRVQVKAVADLFK
jgi:hypothetical protein